MSWMRTPIARVGILLITALVCIFVYILRLAMFIPKEVSRPPKISPTRTAEATSRFLTLAGQWKVIEQNYRNTGSVTPFDVAISESDINTLLASQGGGLENYLPRNLPLKNPVVSLEKDSITISGIAEQRGRQIYVVASGKPILHEGRTVEFVLHSVKIGGWHPPRFVEQALIERIQREASGMKLNLPFPVKEVTVEQGELRIRG